MAPHTLIRSLFFGAGHFASPNHSCYMHGMLKRKTAISPDLKICIRKLLAEFVIKSFCTCMYKNAQKHVLCMYSVHYTIYMCILQMGNGNAFRCKFHKVSERLETCQSIETTFNLVPRSKCCTSVWAYALDIGMLHDLQTWCNCWQVMIYESLDEDRPHWITYPLESCCCSTVPLHGSIQK